MKSIGLLIVFSLVITGCGKTAKKLSDNQLQKVKDFSSSVNQVNTVAADQGVETPNPTMRASEGTGNPSGFVLMAATSSDDSTLKMKTILKQAVQDKLCSFKESTTSAGNQISFGSASGAGLDLNGANSCPATFNISLLKTGTDQIAGNKKTSSKKMSVDYVANAAAFKKLADIDQFTFKADINFESTELNRLDSTIRTKLSGSGAFHSQKTGKIGVQFDSNSEATMTKDNTTNLPAVFSNQMGLSVIKIDFTDFLVELKAELKDGEITYTLNGDKVTEAQVQDYFSGLAPNKSATGAGR